MTPMEIIDNLNAVLSDATQYTEKVLQYKSKCIDTNSSCDKEFSELAEWFDCNIEKMKQILLAVVSDNEIEYDGLMIRNLLPITSDLRST